MESFVLDLAITIVHFGWKDGLPVTELWDALLDGYQFVRHLTDAERAALPLLHSCIDTRFWLSRLGATLNM